MLVIKESKSEYKKPEIHEYGKLKEITMGGGSIETENDRFSF